MFKTFALVAYLALGNDGAEHAFVIDHDLTLTDCAAALESDKPLTIQLGDGAAIIAEALSYRLACEGKSV